jgi:hypothetical protein
MSYNRPDTVLRPGKGTVDSLPKHPVEPFESVARPGTRGLPLARRYEIAWIDDSGLTHDRVEIAPALPAFEEAFSAFTHGVAIATTEGEVAVEDLAPGAMLVCGNGATERLIWKGAITLVPGVPSVDGSPPRLYRVTTETFGPGRPSRDVLFGPAARRLVRGPEAQARTGYEAALELLSASVDGTYLVEVTPIQPLRVYHLLTERHATIIAGGLEVETYHPAPDYALSFATELRSLFLSLFPPLDAERGFGRALWPRMPVQ